MNKFWTQIVFSMIGFGMTSISWAQDCRKPKTQLEMNQCAKRDYDTATKEINQIYNEYRKRLNPSQKEQIKEVQLAWIKYRDLACKFESSGVSGGSAESMIVGVCLTRLTRARIAELKTLSKCEEGDLSCPAHK